MINKLLENEFLVMFKRFSSTHPNDHDLSPSLSLPQFKKFLYSIGMDFMNQNYDSGRGVLFEAEDSNGL